MSDVTDLNALIERLEQPCAWQCLIARGDMSYWANSDVPQEAAQALRTLAERQPVRDGEIITRAARCGHHFKDDCQSCNSAIDWTNAEMDRLRAQGDQAAEQRGADRGLEEAERYRTLAEAALECEYPHLRELARLALGSEK